MKNKKKGINRRTFLALTGTSGAGLFIRSKEKYIHKLIPYVNAPEYPAPGDWSFYLTTCRECPAGCGLMLWYREGRVTKAEGNPEHPVNKGKICIRGQSSVAGQYDPDRLKNVLKKNEENNHVESNWEEALQATRELTSKAEKVKVVSGLQTGSMAGVMETFAAQHGEQPLYYEAFNYESLRKANIEVFGEDLVPRYRIDRSDLVISFGVDFLETWLSPVQHAREFSEFHSMKEQKVGSLVYFGSSQTMTARNSDEFILSRPGTDHLLINGLIQRVYDSGDNMPVAPIDAASTGLTDEMNQKLDQVAEAIKKARHPLILAGRPGDRSPHGTAAVKAATYFNEKVGKNHCVEFSGNHSITRTAFSQETQEFFAGTDENTVLLIHDTNPVFTEPSVKEAIERAGKVIFIGTMYNETAALADWILPSNYALEDWGDYQATDGVVSLMQPVMRTIYDTKSPGDIFLLLMNGNQEISYPDLVKRNWQEWGAFIQAEKSGNPGDSATDPVKAQDTFYHTLLNKGYLSGEVAGDSRLGNYGSRSDDVPEIPGAQEFILQTIASHFFYDGRLANRGWLQEIPHPVSNIVWGSWVDINTSAASDLGIKDGDVIRISAGDHSIEVPARPGKGVEKYTLAMDTGQGHTALGETARNRGVNPFLLLAATAPVSLLKVTIEKTGKKQPLLYLNATADQHDRELLKTERLQNILHDNIQAEEINWPLPRGYTRETDLYKGHEHKDHRWAMVIDLQKCIGCKACEVACYAENNIPVVGSENAREGREMSWLKVVPYETEDGKTSWLPLPCQHCDSAPCEPVCPVYASVHSEEGLNAQIYNRCIGTRYCSNNCPYKVRRFNWINVKHDEPMSLQLNPEVTVRERGVMEKCTFCVQRIRNSEYHAKIEDRPVKDGEIVPACAQTCPTGAITFGDLMDEDAKIYTLLKDNRRYQLLNELNTKTAVFYLKKITI